MAMNPLTPPPVPPQQPQQANPLTPPPGPQAAPQMPEIDPAELPKHIEDTNYAIPIVGRLAHDPKVTRKEVLKAVSDAVGAGKVTATEAVKMLSTIPEDRDDLRAWLKQTYKHMIAGSVVLNAMQHVQGGMQDAG